MDESDKQYRERILNNAANASGGRPPETPGADCQSCHRVDWIILPVRPSVIHTKHGKTLSNAGHQGIAALDPDFAKQTRLLTQATVRVLAQGLVYLYYPDRQRWDVWEVMPNGLTRMVIHQVDAAQYATLQGTFLAMTEPKLCSQGAANAVGHTITIPAANGIKELWMFYSGHWWSPSVLKQYGTNPALRAQRGRQLHPAQAIKDKKAGAGCLPLTAANVQAHVADFAALAEGAARKPYEAAFAESSQPLDMARLGLAPALEQRVRAAEKARHPSLYVNTSQIVLLPDALGVTAEHNHLRLMAQEGQKAWVAGGPDFAGNDADVARAWKVRSALHLQMLEQWAMSGALAHHRDLFERTGNIGQTRTHISAGDYLSLQRPGAKSPYPPGTRFEKVPISGSKRLVTYKVVMPEAGIADLIEEQAKAAAGLRIKRYTERVRMGDPKKPADPNTFPGFKKAFDAGVQRWAKHIEDLDADYVAALQTPALAHCMKYDFESSIRLTKKGFNAALGTVQQQCADVLSRITAVDKAWGGGGISKHSAQLLAKAYGKDPNQPAMWINEALLQPWGLKDAILNDPGKQKDVAEKITQLATDVREEAHQVWVAVRQTLKAAADAKSSTSLSGMQQLQASGGMALSSLIQTQRQAAHYQQALLDPQQAAKMKLAATTMSEVDRCFAIHVRTSVVFEMMTDPVKEPIVTLSVKVPVGPSLDAVQRGIHPPMVPPKVEDAQLELKTKQGTTRNERRLNRFQLERLDRINEVLQRPQELEVMLKQSTLTELKKQATKAGEKLVEVTASGPMASTATLAEGQTFKLPQGVALRLVQDQATLAKASMQAVWSRQGGLTAVLGIFQWRALQDALGKLDGLEGTAYADTLMTVCSSTAGLVEGGLGLTIAAYEIRVAGGKLVLTSRLIAAAQLRLLAGMVGAAGSAFDAYAAFVKASSRKSRGEGLASFNYNLSGASFAFSAGALGTSAILAYANITIKRYVISQAIIAGAGGAAAAGTLASTLTGVGILLAILGFGLMLYAESLEDDVNEIFIKRSYWGNHERQESPFGEAQKPNLSVGTADQKLSAQLKWVTQGMIDEIEAFKALSIGYKASIEWNDNWFQTDSVQVTLETPVDQKDFLLQYEFAVYDGKLKTLMQQSEKAAKMAVDASSGRWVKTINFKLNSEQWNSAKRVQFNYTVYKVGDVPQSAIAGDRMTVKKP